MLSDVSICGVTRSVGPTSRRSIVCNGWSGLADAPKVANDAVSKGPFSAATISAAWPFSVRIGGIASTRAHEDRLSAERNPAKSVPSRATPKTPPLPNARCLVRQGRRQRAQQYRPAMERDMRAGFRDPDRLLPVDPQRLDTVAEPASAVSARPANFADGTASKDRAIRPRGRPRRSPPRSLGCAPGCRCRRTAQPFGSNGATGSGGTAANRSASAAVGSRCAYAPPARPARCRSPEDPPA